MCSKRNLLRLDQASRQAGSYRHLTATCVMWKPSFIVISNCGRAHACVGCDGGVIPSCPYFGAHLTASIEDLITVYIVQHFIWEPAAFHLLDLVTNYLLFGSSILNVVVA